MFGFEWNEKEEREALLEAGEARDEARGEARSRINTIRNMLADGLVTMDAIKATGRYSPEELAAICLSAIENLLTAPFQWQPTALPLLRSGAFRWCSLPRGYGRRRQRLLLRH